MTDDQPASILEDEPTHLRVWGTDTVYRLPAAPNETAVIWSGDLADVALTSPAGAPLPASITRAWDRWILRANAGPLVVDGARQPAVMLTPGLEVQIDGVTLVAEGRRWSALRAFVARLIGWSSAQAIDRAMRAIRLAAERRAPLALCGPGDVIALAQEVHRRAFRGTPFVACDPRRRSAPATVRSVHNVDTVAAALGNAEGGSLCFWSRRLPGDVDQAVADMQRDSPAARIIVCSAERRRRVFGVDQIVIPPLFERADDVQRIIDEYADDEAEEQNATRGLGSGDRGWIAIHAARTIPEISKAARRLVAIRNSASASAAARAIGMKPVSLVRWFERGRARPDGVVVRQQEAVTAFRAAHFRIRSSSSARTA